MADYLVSWLVMMHLQKLAPSILALVCAGNLLHAQDAPTHDAIARAIIKEAQENSGVMTFQDELCHNYGSRLTGSRAFDLAADYAVEQFRSMGLEANLVPWGEWRVGWDREQWMGRMTKPTQIELQVACPAWTGSTKGIQKGRLIPMPATMEQYQSTYGQADSIGEHWLYGPMPKDAEVRAKVIDLLKGEHEIPSAVGVVQSAASTGWNDKRYENQIRVFGDSTAALKPYEDRQKWPHVIVRDDQAKLLEAAIAVAQKAVISKRVALTPMVEFEVRNRWRRGPVILNNVVADLVGTEFPDEYVIICAHLDSWHQATGATDNGTGTCSTLEVARILTKIGFKPKRTIRFILWGGEEQGLLGSRQFVVQNRTRMHKVAAVFNHDSGTNWAHRLTVAKSQAADFEQVIAPITALMKPADHKHEGPAFSINPVEVMKPAGGGSDHASFAAVGVPAFSWQLTGHIPYARGWHSQWDTMSIVVPSFQKHNATVFAVVAAGIANLDHMLSRKGVERATPGGRARIDAQLVLEAWLGIAMNNLKVTAVTPDSIADKAKFLMGDRFISVAATDVNDAPQMLAALRTAASEDDEVLVAVMRQGKRTELRVRP